MLCVYNTLLSLSACRNKYITGKIIVVLNLRTPSTSTTWTPRTKRGRHLRTNCPKAGATPPSEMCVCVCVWSLPAACGLSQRPLAWLHPRLLNSPSIHISHLFHPSSSLSSLPCSHLSCQSNSFPFIVLCPLGSLWSLFVGCPFFHPGVLFFFLTWLFFLSLYSFEMSRYIFQFSVFQSGLFTSSSFFLFSFIRLSQLFSPTPFCCFSLTLYSTVFIICPLLKACLILSRPTFPLSFIWSVSLQRSIL